MSENRSVLDAIRDGTAELEWVSLASQHRKCPGYQLTMTTLRDAVRVDGVRRCVTPGQAQQAADLLDCYLMTPLLVDRRWEQASLQLEPVYYYDGLAAGRSKSYARQARHSELVDDQLREAGWAGAGLLEPVGKHWVLTRSREPVNYGWPVADDSPETTWATGRAVTDVLRRLLQGLGGTHRSDHTDASQTLAGVVARHGILRHPGGEEEVTDLADLAADAKLWRLVSAEGPLHAMRLRHVPELQPVRQLMPPMRIRG